MLEKASWRTDSECRMFLKTGRTQRADSVSTVQIAAKMKMKDFKGGPPWCQKGPSHQRTDNSATPSQLQGKSYKLPQIHSNKDCRGFHRTGRHHQIRMKYLPRLTCLSLGLLTRKVNCHKRTHFTFVQKLPPLVIFKRMTMQKKKLPREIVVKVNKKGWMIESIKRTNLIPAVIPGSATKYLQPLDISGELCNKVALEREAWMTRGDKSFTKTGHMWRKTFAQVCRRILEQSQKLHYQRWVFERLDCWAMKTTTGAEVQICLKTKATLRVTMKDGLRD